MLLETRAVAPFYKNGSVVACEQTREGVLIDPGDEVEELLGIIAADHIDVKYILLTHAHVDHVTGVARAKQQVGAPIYLHRDDLFLYEAAGEQAALFGFTAAQPPPVDRFYANDDRIGFGTYEARVHHTPGHCPGGVCLQVGKAGEVGKHLFVGDTLFAGSIGRTDLPGGDYATLIRSITDVLFRLGDDAVVHPGHGPSTTIGQEKRTNPFLRDVPFGPE